VHRRLGHKDAALTAAQNGCRSAGELAGVAINNHRFQVSASVMSKTIRK